MSEKSNELFLGDLTLTSPMGDEVYQADDRMIVKIMGKRGVLSTCNLNGGYRQDIKYIFNYSCGKHPDVQAKRSTGMRGLTMLDHYEGIAEELGLPLDSSTGMETAALIENYALSERCYHGVKVMAISTAGIDVNGGRAGDKAAYDEFTETDLLPAGTINILVFIDAKLDAGTLSRAMLTATEAKTVALQELMANSMYSEGLATGSGTDSMILVCNDESKTQLYNSGKHVLLGEMIAETVIESVKEALAKQTDMTPKRQASIEWQCKRYGLSKEHILQTYVKNFPDTLLEPSQSLLDELDRDNTVLGFVAAITHLCDQSRWGMIADPTLLSLGQSLLEGLFQSEGIEDKPRTYKNTCSIKQSTEPAYRKLLSDTLLCLAKVLHHRSDR